MRTLKQKTFNGLIWSSVERFSTQGVQFALGLILARLLLPSDYGLIGMLAIFLAISETFIQSGFTVALIQKKKRDDLDYSTTFFFNIVIALIFYTLLFISAPLIANFYQEPQLQILTRVIGFTIVINSLSVVQRAKFTINVDFKTQTKASLLAISISGIISISLAYKGFGVWALVVQTLLRRTIDVGVLWYISKWRPKKGFSYERFKRLFSFGYKLLLSGLLDTFFRNVYSLIIGKIFNANTLGFFTRANQFSDFTSSNISNILGRVTFPILSELQDENQRLRKAYTKIIQMTALLIFPLMMGMAALAEPMIITILTEKWSETIWMLQLLCFAAMWYPIHAINLSILNVKGRSDIFLKLEIIKKSIITIVLLVTVPLGIKAILIGQIVSTYIALIINLHYTKRIINYGFWNQMKDILPVLILSFAMGAMIYLTIPFFSSNIIKLVIGLAEGVIFYLGFAYLFNIAEIKSIPSFIMKVKK
jgi:O-antigen/teichoic acid export membrane protein